MTENEISKICKIEDSLRAGEILPVEAVEAWADLLEEGTGEGRLVPRAAARHINDALDSIEEMQDELIDDVDRLSNKSIYAEETIRRLKETVREKAQIISGLEDEIGELKDEIDFLAPFEDEAYDYEHQLERCEQVVSDLKDRIDIYEEESRWQEYSVETPSQGHERCEKILGQINGKFVHAPVLDSKITFIGYLVQFPDGWDIQSDLIPRSPENSMITFDIDDVVDVVPDKAGHQATIYLKKQVVL